MQLTSTAPCCALHPSDKRPFRCSKLNPDPALFSLHLPSLHAPAPLCSALTKIAPRAVSYPEQSQQIREHLAKVLETEEEWTKAAQVLQGIDLDSGQHTCMAGVQG